jgi:hypothetical protein
MKESMHPTAQKFFDMSSSQRRQVHLYLASIALKQLKKFEADGIIPRFYTETVCGTCQEVDMNLPSEALECIIEKTDPNQIAEWYLEPICALQDEDWPLPDAAQFAYYAIYNTFKKYALGKETDDWLIVNQALSSFGEGFAEADAAFEAAIKEVA